MIIFEDKTWQTDTANPNGNYLSGIDCEQPKWIVPDGSELALKIMSTPCWNPIEDEDGNLIDIIPVEATMSDEEQVLKLKSELEELDRQAIRPLRAIAAGNDTEKDREILADLEEQAEVIRLQIAKIEG